MTRPARTLSVCLLTHDTTMRTAAVLETLRPVATEIVVAVDSRTGAAAVSPYIGLADRLFRFEFAHPIERAYAWLSAQCSGTWILQIDSDEVPSAGLIAALPQLLEADDVHQFPIPRRWLVGDYQHWLDQSPWWPDYQFRLLRNDPATLWFRGTRHGAAYPARPARYLELPIYHVDFLLNSYIDRLRKIEQYADDTTEPGAVADSIFYLPEDCTALRLAPVPAEDAMLIDRILAASQRPIVANDPVPDVPVAGRQDIDRHWNGRPVSDDALKATLAVLEHDRWLGAGERRVFHVRVHNQGHETWPYGPHRRPEITICYRWLSPDGSVAVAEGLHSPLTASSGPGEIDIVPFTVDAPGAPGQYQLEVDLMLSRTRWFGTPATIQCTVTE